MFLIFYLFPFVLFASGEEAAHNSPDVSGLIWRTITFAVFISISYKFIKKPFIGFMGSRTGNIKDSIDAAIRLKTEANSKMISYKTKLKKLEGEIGVMKEKHMKIVEIEKKNILEETNNNIEKIKDLYSKTIDFEILKKHRTLKNETGKLVMEKARKKLANVVTKDKQDAAMEYLLKRLVK